MPRRTMTRQPGTRRPGAPWRAVVIISTIAVALVLLLASAVEATGEAPPPGRYRVAVGDSLWEIASEHGPDDRDPRDVVEEIRRLNDLEGSIIHAGQVLEIPSG